MTTRVDLIVQAFWKGAGLARGEKELSKLERAAVSFGKVAKAGALAAAGAMVAFAKQSTEAFISFEKGMAEVNTLLPQLTGEAFDQMTADVQAFAIANGRLTSEVVPALYQSISAGVPQENVFDFMQVASNAAAGGVTDLETAVDGITSVVNAYGEETVNAQQASDLMFTAVKLGKTNFEQLSNSLFNVIPVASSLGVEFGDVTAALASITAQGVPTSVATTQIRSALVALSKEGGVTAKAFEEIAGKSFRQFIADGGDLQGALKLLEAEADRTNGSITDFFTRVEAGNAALALTGQGAEKFTDNLEEMDGAAGATSEAATIMKDTTQKAIDEMAAAWEGFLLDVGQRIAPSVEDAAKLIATVLTAMTDTHEDAIQGMIDSNLEGAESFEDVQIEATKVADALIEASNIAGEVSGAYGILLDNATNLAATHGDFSGSTDDLARSLAVLFEGTVRVTNGQVFLNDQWLGSVEELTNLSKQIATTNTLYSKHGDVVEDVADATEEANQAADKLRTAWGKLTGATEDNTDATEAGTEAAHERADAISDKIDLVEKAAINEEHLKDVLDAQTEASIRNKEANEAATEALAEFNARQADVFLGALEGAESFSFFNESLDALGQRTIVVSNLTGDQRTSLSELQEEYDKTRESIVSYETGVASLGLTEEERNEKIAEQQEHLVAIEGAMQPLLDVTDDYVSVTSEATINQDAINQAMFDAAVASGATADELAILGGALGLYSDEAVAAALKTAAIQAEIDRLAQLYVQGKISVEDMQVSLDKFITTLDKTPEEKEVIIDDNLKEAAERAGRVKQSIEEIPSSKSVMVDIVSRLTESIHGAGVNVGEELDEGISDGLRESDKSSDAAEEMVDDIVESARDAGGIQSPSTRMRDFVAGPLIDGLVEGVIDGSDLWQEAIGEIIDIGIEEGRGRIVEAQPSIFEAIEDLFDFGGDLSGVAGGFADIFEEQMLDPLEEAIGLIDEQLENEELHILEVLDLLNQRNELENEYIEQLERVQELQEAQAQLDFLQQQLELLNLLDEAGIDPAEFLGGVELGAGADPGQLVDLMSQALEQILAQLTLPTFQHGGIVGGSGGTDSLLARLTPGEGVLSPDVMRALGENGFNRLNAGDLTALGQTTNNEFNLTVHTQATSATVISDFNLMRSIV